LSSIVGYFRDGHAGRFVSLSRLIASSAIAVSLGVPLASAQTPINVETWPDDVPCDVLKKNPDGSYLITVPITRFFTTHTSMQFKNTRETRYWDQKCKGKTQ
jgi:hypothetical protein